MMLRIALTVALVAPLFVVQHGTAQQSGGLGQQELNAFHFRSIGPAVTGGRIHDIEVHPSAPATVLLGTASGGLWRSVNNGTTWDPVFDDQPVATFGDVTIAPSDPRIVYAGTGEQNNRQSTSWGNGVYRSDDGGVTWRHLGLDGTHHTGRVLVDPRDPETVLVGALGNLWAPGAERGVYRSTDGGRTWQQTLFVDTLTGVVDMELHPSNPDVVYAAAYQRLRTPWGFNGGGAGSGIYRSRDGGVTWQKLTNGLPAAPIGRIGLATTPASPDVVLAIVEHREEGGVYRSEDGGSTWTRVNSLNPRPMYYSHIFLDPTTDQRAYMLATQIYKSEDGGRNWEMLPYQPMYDVGVHSDFHALWIDPAEPSHFLLGGDGGLFETWDMGETFRLIDNFAIGQFYAIGVDMRDPYHVYGGMQDNHSWVGPTATRHWIGIINDDWRQIGFGDGMYQQVDPTSHRYVYSSSNDGSYSRVDAETGDILDISPREPAGEPGYRFDWTSPSLVSQHDPATVYVGGNRLFISRDRGESWTRTEDLSRQIDRDTLTIMGVRGSDILLSRNDGVSTFGQVVTIAESPLDADVLWVGTDDGNVQVSRDGGASWTEVGRNVQGVQDGTYVSRVTASHATPGAALVAFDGHRHGDFRPYLFRTDDFGRTWTPVMRGFPADGVINDVIEDPSNPRVLYAGTENGLYVSLDAGASWLEFAQLPSTLYDDILIHPREHDLVVGTHGRSILILDDVRPLAEWSPELAAQPVHLFPIRRATAFHYWKDTSYRAQAAYAGENPTDGAILTYWIGRDAPAATITVSDAAGNVVRTLEAEGSQGMHRTNWDLRYEPPPAGGFGGQRSADDPRNRALPRPPRNVEARGPFVAPGTYTVTVNAGGQQSTQTVEVRADPQMPHITDDMHRERVAFLLEVAALQREAAGLAQAAERGTELAQRLSRARSRLNGVANDFNGASVRPGSMHLPTETHRRLVAEARAELEVVEQELDAAR
ncbi:MAG: VPS10 domain-containing protein [Longimicrobiales bacterium]